MSRYVDIEPYESQENFITRVMLVIEDDRSIKSLPTCSIPTADVVNVVRCKDCKHCFVDGTNVRYNVCELNHNKVQGDNWFCADGERRTE